MEQGENKIADSKHTMSVVSSTLIYLNHCIKFKWPNHAKEMSESDGIKRKDTICCL